MTYSQKYYPTKPSAASEGRSNTESPERTRSRGKGAAAKSTPPKRILIVDEDILSIADLSRALLRFGYVLSQATDLRRAIEAVKEEKPDLVICALDGQESEALQLVKTVQRAPYSRNVPFLFIIESRRDFDQAPQILGPKQYLTKPFTSEQLSSAVQDQLARRTERRVS